MSLLAKVARTTAAAVKGVDLRHWEALRYMGSGATSAGVHVGVENAIRLPVVYACRRLISYGIASLPVDVITKSYDEHGFAVRTPYRDAPRWVRRPNAEQLWPEFCAQMVGSLLDDGNLFLDRRRRVGSVPTDLFVLDPRKVIVGRVQETRQLFFTVITDRGLVTLGPDDIQHIKAMTAYEDRGLSPLQAAREAIGVGLARQTYVGRFYVNGATVSAVLQFSAGVTPEQAKDTLTRFREDYSGAGNAQKIGGLIGAEYKQVAVSMADAQFIESSKLTNIDVATRIHGIPPHRVGENTDKPQFGNNLEQSNLAYVQDALVPYIVLLEAGLFELLPPAAYFHFNLTATLRGDSKARAAFYQAMQQLGDLCANEVRALEDLNPYPGGHVFRAPLNLGVIGADGVPILPERPAEASPEAPSSEDGE